MDQGLKRVVARGVRPHIPYRSLNKICDSLADRKIENLFRVYDSLSIIRRHLELMSSRNYGNKFYYNLKKDFYDLKNKAEEIRKQDWFLRHKERYMAKKRYRHTIKQNKHPSGWL